MLSLEIALVGESLARCRYLLHHVNSIFESKFARNIIVPMDNKVAVTCSMPQN